MPSSSRVDKTARHPLARSRDRARSGGPSLGFAKTLIDGSSIKKHSIPANRLEDHSITAEQLKASKLIRWNFAINKGQAARFPLGPMTLLATCAADGTNTKAELDLQTSETGSVMSTNPDGLPGPLTTMTAGVSYPIVEEDSATANDGNSAFLLAFDPQKKLAAFSTAQTIGLAINTPGANCRFFGYLVNDA